ncbi:MAG: hypothetical protein ACJASQ_002381 [Crocinitomicaceae bacterium]|jgi:hypothetical protein
MRILIVCIAIGCSQVLFAQNEDSISFNFYQLEEVYGVFEVRSSTGDTAVILGNVEIANDTIYFTEFRDSIALKLSGMNGTYGFDTIDLIDFPKINMISSKFAYLGNRHKLIALDTVDYVINDSLVTTFMRSDLMSDTLHLINFVPRKAYTLYLKNEHMQSEYINLKQKWIMIGRSRRGKDDNFEIATNWILKYDVYCSVNPLNIDVQEIVGDSLFLGKRRYTMVYLDRK